MQMLKEVDSKNHYVILKISISETQYGLIFDMKKLQKYKN